jgi:polyhydroxyalkanoate synthesis regulator phasin
MAGATKKNSYQQALIEKQVYDWLIGGWSNKLIIDELIENHKYKYDNARYLIDKVVKSIRVTEEAEIEDLKNKYLSMHLDLYKKCLDASETRTANEVLKSITKLQGLDINKVEVKDTTYEIEF